MGDEKDGSQIWGTRKLKATYTKEMADDLKHFHASNLEDQLLRAIVNSHMTNLIEEIKKSRIK